MKRIGRSVLIPFFLCILGALCSVLEPVQAQEFELEASLSENQVFVGEQFFLQIEVKGSSMRTIGLPELPVIDGIRNISSTPSRGQSISIINGQTRTTTTYTYTLIARTPGTFTIPPVSVTIDGEPYQTDPLEVDVIQQRSLQDSEHRRPDIFAQIEIDEEQPVVGQQLIASLVIYFKTSLEVTSYQPAAGWRTDGFWKEQLENIEQPRAESVILGDVRYRKATLLRYALFPSRSGDLTLSPFEINLGIRTQPRRNDPFGSVFGGLGTNQRRVTLETEEMNIPVSRVEPPGQGISIGAVGQFDIERTISANEVHVGETVELTTTISGEGNLSLINRPRYPFPDHIELYSPQEQTDINRRGTTISGTRTFTDRFVPNTEGTFTIPESRIAVYDPSSNRYSYQTLPEITMNIQRDPDAVIADVNDDLNLDLKTGQVSWQSPPGDPGTLFKTVWFWAGLLLPLFALLFALHKRRLLNRLSRDEAFARAYKAWDKVEERILKAESHLSADRKTVYQILHKTITGYVSDKSGLPKAGLTDNMIRDEVLKQTGSTRLAEKIHDQLNKCSSISYSPVESREDLMEDIRTTKELLRELRSCL